jgi:transcriptional regulator with XRE-family HTH domain
MTELTVDLDELATRLRSKMEERDLSIRGAAAEIGCGAATLSRLLQGSESPTTPDLANVDKATAWLGLSVADLGSSQGAVPSTIADVEVHLRALPDLSPPDVEALVAMVRAGYETAKKLRAQKQPKR